MPEPPQRGEELGDLRAEPVGILDHARAVPVDGDVGPKPGAVGRSSGDAKPGLGFGMTADDERPPAHRDPAALHLPGHALRRALR